MAATTNFDGFGPGACDWFAGLEAENTKGYFAATKPVFEAEVKAPMQALLADMENRFGGRAKLFRQHRDVRFSKDKSPYKTGAYGGIYREDHALGWYVAIDAKGFFAGRGVYEMSKDQLAAFRDAVADGGGGDLADAISRAEAAGIELSGDALKTAPRGYDRDHPRVDLLRRKNLILGARIGADQVTGVAPWRHATDVWKKVQPVSDWMDRALGL